MRRTSRSFAVALLLLAGLKAPDAASADGGRGDRTLLFLQALDQRLADVSWRIATTNAELCPLRTNAIGISVHNAAQYAPAHRKAAIETFGFGDGLPAVLAVSRGGPADLAGLRQGDRIASLDGEPIAPVPPSRTAKEDYASIGAVASKLERLPDDRPVHVVLARDGGAVAVTIRPRQVCRSRVEVVPGGQINANSNGDVVQIYGKLVLWAKADDELAIVVAHEMAHNILSHNQRIEREGIDTGFLASLGGDGRKLRDIEREADRYGLYLAARAGYDYRLAPDFWRRLSATAGLGGVWATTHPTGRNRAAFNQGVVDEIDSKKAAGLALMP